MVQIDRLPLRDKIRQELTEQLLRGELEPGRRLNETSLTESLGVSRTPLREALIQLEYEGMVASEPNKGFRVRPMSRSELTDLLKVGIELETLGLRATSRFTDDRLEELCELDDRRRELLKDGYDEDRLVELDDRWHRTLIGGCQNEVLNELLRIVRNRLYRYIYLMETSRDEVEKAISEHDEIIEALEDDDVESATGLLRRHWTRTVGVMKNLMQD